MGGHFEQKFTWKRKFAPLETFHNIDKRTSEARSLKMTEGPLKRARRGLVRDGRFPVECDALYTR